jgi:hypothetical protein
LFVHKSNNTTIVEILDLQARSYKPGVCCMSSRQLRNIGATRQLAGASLVHFGDVLGGHAKGLKFRLDETKLTSQAYTFCLQLGNFIAAPFSLAFRQSNPKIKGFVSHAKAPRNLFHRTAEIEHLPNRI